MNIIYNQSLKKYNTFGIEAFAKEFIEINTSNELAEVLKNNSTKKLFILAGGSNMLLTQNIDALVLHINNKGIEIIKEDESHVWVKGSAGEIWHEFVLWNIANNFGGIENLSLIPGNVGATPIQNIGAYGIEIKDTMESCEAMEIATQEIKTFSNSDCQFGYRESIFKNELKNKYIILSVTFKLTKTNHKLNTTYGAIDVELSKMNIEKPSIKDVSRAVIAIRESKLPNPKELGNSGSFFKNPAVPIEIYENAKAIFPDIPHYPISENKVKVPAGWLIEQAGFKGKRIDDAGVHTKQALVLVNYGNATGNEIWALAQTIQKAVKEKFGIDIEAEVNVI